MTTLGITVAILAAITILNVMLLMAVVRRLAQHERQLGELGHFSLPTGLLPGDPVPLFSAQTLDGEPIDTSTVREGLSIVAFYSTTCDVCLTDASELVKLTSESVPVVAMLSGTGGHFDRLTQMLEPLPMIRVPEVGGEILDGFRVDAFPSLYLIQDGHVIRFAGSAAELRDGLPVATPSPNGA